MDHLWRYQYRYKWYTDHDKPLRAYTNDAHVVMSGLAFKLLNINGFTTRELYSIMIL